MKEDDDRDWFPVPRHDEAPGEHGTVTPECHLLHIEGDPLTRDAAERDLPSGTRGKRYSDSVSAIGPSIRALPDAIRTGVQPAGGSIEFQPAQRMVIGRGDIDQGAIGQAIGAEVAIRRVGCVHN